MGSTVETITRYADLGTLLIINALLAALSAAIFLALCLARKSSQRVRGALLWSASYGVFAIGFGVLTLPGFDVDIDHLPLAGNLLIDGGAVLALVAANTYLERPGRDLWVLLPAGLLGLVEVCYVLTQGQNYRVMVILGCALRGTVTMATGVTLWRCASDTQRAGARLAAAFHFLWAAVLLDRMIWWVSHPLADIGDDPTTAYELLSRLVLTWVITPCLLWMLSRELDAKLIRYAHEDTLTGIANRRVVWERGEFLASGMDGHATLMAVLIIDVDHFKVVNDTWGHDSGDQVLIAVVRALSTHVRSQDLLARVGGEEFMLLIGQANEPMASDIAERLRHSVQSQEIALRTGGVLACTVSIGYCVALRGSLPWQDIVVAADRALYAAKHAGRNRVVGTRVQSSTGPITALPPNVATIDIPRSSVA